MPKLIYPEDVDKRLNWPLGRAGRLARRGRLPHVVLPDGAIRFSWSEVRQLIQHVAREPRPNGKGVTDAQ